MPRQLPKHSETDAARILDEVARGKILLTCDKHNFAPGGKAIPMLGCRDCVLADLLFTWGTMPLEKREEWVHKMYDAARRMTELAERGKFDFIAFEHPEVSIERN